MKPANDYFPYQTTDLTKGTLHIDHETGEVYYMFPATWKKVGSDQMAGIDAQPRNMATYIVTSWKKVSPQ